MRDYYFIPNGQGPQIPVSEMLTCTILRLLRDGFNVEPGGPDRADVIERLRIELTARRLGC